MDSPGKNREPRSMGHRFSRKRSGLMIKIPEMTFPRRAILTAATSALLLLLLQGNSCDRPGSGGAAASGVLASAESATGVSPSSGIVANGATILQFW